jgi:microtubule-associated protein-like 6
MKSHYEYELWALTINPTNSYECETGGGDKTLRIWDLKKYKQKGFLMLPEDFRAIDWSSDGKFIIIGTLTGLIYYVDANTLKRSSPFKSIFFGETSSKKKTKKQIEKEKTNPAKWIQELKISPNDEYCAFGSHCGIGKTFSKIQVLKITGNINNPFKTYATIDPKITSATTHLDWGNDNDRIVVNSLAFELKYISLGAKSVIKASSNVYEDDMWHTWTCLFGFPVQGIWPPATTGYYVNYTCMSNNHKVIYRQNIFSN